MSSAEIRAALTQCLDVCGQTLKALFRQPILEANPAASNSSSNSTPAISVLRTDFMSLLALVDSNITKFGMSLKPPLTGAGVVKSLQGASKDLETLGSCALSVHPSNGIAIRKEFIWTAQEVVESVQALVSGLLSSFKGANFETPDDYLRRVGSVHAVLDKVRGSLSMDNAAAVEKRWVLDSSSLDDALRECKEMIDNAENSKDESGEEDLDDDDDDDGWGDEDDENLTGEELERAKKIYPILRMIALLHRKAIKFYRVSSGIDLDFVLGRSLSIVASFDEVVASLSPGQDMDIIKFDLQVLLEWVQEVRADVDLDKVEDLKLDDGTKSSPNALSKWFTACFEQIDKASKGLNI